MEMSPLSCIIRFAVALTLMILAIFVFLYAMLFLMNVGPLGPPRPGYMQTTAISLGPVTLVGWQMHIPYFVLWALATALGAAGAWLVGNTLFRLVKQCG